MRRPARRRAAPLHFVPRFVAGLAALALAALGLAASAAPAAAQQRVVALAPLATMGAEDTSATAAAHASALEKAIAALPTTRTIAPAQVAQAIKRARKPGLAACDGEPGCIAELGKLIGASVVVIGQSGGLGEARVIYLRAIDTATAKELGSTTWTTGGSGAEGSGGDSAAAAVVRLLAPAAYTGRLLLSLTVRDATVYINGKKLGPVGRPSSLAPSSSSSSSSSSSISPTGAAPPPIAAAYALSVGTHALRVTHPEYRDFVRFVDVSYGATTEVKVALSPLPIVQRDLAARRAAAAGKAGPAPWYGRWWAVAGGATALALIAGAIAYSAADDFDPDVTLP